MLYLFVVIRFEASQNLGCICFQIKDKKSKTKRSWRKMGVRNTEKEGEVEKGNGKGRKRKWKRLNAKERRQVHVEWLNLIGMA